MILQPVATITGAVVGAKVGVEINFIIGLGIIILGIFLFATGLQELVEIEKPPKFLKSIKRADKRMIERTLDKIENGLGHNKHRRHEEFYSIRTDKGGRIFYKIKLDGSIVLTEYVSSSKHH